MKAAWSCRGRNPHQEAIVDVDASRETSTGARREDLWGIWDVMGTRNRWEVTSSKNAGRLGEGSELFWRSEVVWETLEQVLDLSNEEWEAPFNYIAGAQVEQENNEHDDEEKEEQ